MTDNNVTDNAAASRYELAVGDEVAVLEYRHMGGDTIIFVHTGVPESLEGQGVGNRMVVYALEDARTRSLEVIPLCPFVAAHIRRHPEYMDLVSSRYKGFANSE